MNKKTFFRRQIIKDHIFIITLSLLIAVCFGFAAKDMNFWPTDTRAYYFDLSVKLPELNHISEIHQFIDETNVRFVHGKEMYIICASIMQRLINDLETIRPFLFVCIVALCGSSILIFSASNLLWGRIVGYICYTIFITCFWPYQYALYTGHQLSGLFFFLCSLCVLLCKLNGKAEVFSYFLSGLLLCLSIYSSIVSALYIPYYFAGFLYINRDVILRSKIQKQLLFRAGVSLALCLLGFLCGFIYFNYPNITQNVKKYFEFIEISSSRPHFYYNQPVLIQWISHPELPVRGGWLWIIKYFMVIMPVLFPAYLLSIVYVAWNCLKMKGNAIKQKLYTIGIILLSLSTFALAEMRGVAQIGRNYFTFIIGLIMLLGYALHLFLKSAWWKNAKKKKIFITFALIIFAINIFLNAVVFFGDVYPTRMATTFLSRTIRALDVQTLYIDFRNYHRRNIMGCLNQDIQRNVKFIPIQSIYQPKEGYIVVPPLTGNSIYNAAHTKFNDFDKDIYVNELARKNKLSDYAVASFPMLTSSKIWVHEAEVLSYKTLILNHPVWKDFYKTKVWVLDARKLQQDRIKNLASKDYVYLIENNIKNIGTKNSVYMFEGFAIDIHKKVTLKTIPMKLSKVGDPKDSLVAYVYKVASDQPVWIPLGDNFSSEPASARIIGRDARGELVQFNFSSPLILSPGKYKIVMYRTGMSSDDNFYRVHLKK